MRVQSGRLVPLDPTQAQGGPREHAPTPYPHAHSLSIFRPGLPSLAHGAALPIAAPL